MYGICYLIHFPHEEDPRLESMEIFNSFEEAEERTREIMKNFFDEYGEDDFGTVYPSKNKPKAVMFNGEVTGFVFIKEIETK